MPTWPGAGTLPQKPKYGMAERRQTNMSYFMPDVGTPKARRRSTAVSTITQVTFEFNDTQLAAFKTFYETTCLDGSLPFDWAHPVTGVVSFWLFSPDEAPTIEATTINFHTVSFNLVRLP